MNTLKNMLKKRGISLYFAIAAFACGLVTLTVYTATGKNEFTPELSGKIIALYDVFLVFTAAISVLEVKLGKYGVYLIGLWAWLEYLIAQGNYLVNIIVAIDGSTFSAGFILTTLFGALAWIMMLVSAILQKKELGSSNAENAAQPAEVTNG